MATIELTVELTYVERVKAHLAVASGSLAALLGLAFFPACGIRIVATTKTGSDWLSRLLAAACFVFVPAALLAGAHRGHVASGKKGPPVFRLAPEGIEIKTRTAELKLAWAGIQRVRTRFGLLLVCTSRKCAYPLPLRSLEPRQLDSVLTWAGAGAASSDPSRE